MEKHLDKFIKNKLSEQRFPLDDDAWEGMETILDSSDPPSLVAREKPFKLYKLAGLLSLMVLCYAIYMFSMKKRNANLEEIHQLKTIVENTEPRNETIADISNTEEKETSQLSKSIVKSRVDEELDINTRTAQTSTHQILANDAYEKEIKPTNNQFGITTIKQLSNEALTEKRSDVAIQQSAEQRMDFTDNGTHSSVGNTEIVETSKETINARSVIATIESLQYVKNAFLTMDSQFTKLPQYMHHQQEVAVVKENRRPLFGAYLASQNYTTDRLYLAGVHGQLFLNKNMSLSIEPGYSYRALEQSSVAKDSSEFVSFGANTFEQDIVGQSVHAVHLPANLNYYLSDQFTLGAGVSYNHVLALGAIKETRIDGIVTEEKEIWLDKEFYTTQFYRGQINAAYFLSQHLSVDVQYEMPLKRSNLFNEESSIGLRLKLYL